MACSIMHVQRASLEALFLLEQPLFVIAGSKEGGQYGLHFVLESGLCKIIGCINGSDAGLLIHACTEPV